MTLGGLEGQFFTPPTLKNLPRAKTSLNERSDALQHSLFATPGVVEIVTDRARRGLSRVRCQACAARLT